MVLPKGFSITLVMLIATSHVQSICDGSDDSIEDILKLRSEDPLQNFEDSQFIDPQGKDC